MGAIFITGIIPLAVLLVAIPVFAVKAGSLAVKGRREQKECERMWEEYHRNLED